MDPISHPESTASRSASEPRPADAFLQRIDDDLAAIDRALILADGEDGRADESAETVVRLIEAHIRAYQQVLLPLIDEMTDDEFGSSQIVDEHRTFREHLAVLQRIDWAGAERAGGLTGLRLDFPPHAAAERETIARVAGALDDRRAASLHEAYELARMSTLLTDPIVPLDDVSRATVDP